MVGAWFPAAGNAPRVGLRQFVSGRCCNGHGGVLVFSNTSANSSHPPRVRGTTGVVGHDMNKKYESLEEDGEEEASGRSLNQKRNQKIEDL